MSFQRSYLIAFFLLIAVTLVSTQSALWYMVIHKEDLSWLQCPEIHVTLDDNTSQLRADEMGDFTEEEEVKADDAEVATK